MTGDESAKRNRRICPICEEPQLHILELYYHIGTEHEDWEEPLANYRLKAKEAAENYEQ